MYDIHHKEYYRTLRLAARHQSYSFGDNISPAENHEWGYCCYPNSHDSLELLLITDGQVHWKAGMDEYLLRPGDIMVINPFEDHEGTMNVYEGGGGYYVIYIDIDSFIPHAGIGTAELLQRILSGDEAFRPFIPAAENERLAPLICELHRIFTGEEDESAICLELSLSWAILAELLRFRYVPNRTAADKRRFSFINNVENFIRENYFKDISTADISASLGYTTNHFCRLFSACYGTCFSRYLRSYRIRKVAWQHLSRLDLSIAEIAAEVGFTDYNYFSRAFKQELGLTPTEWFARRRNIPGQIRQKTI